VRGLMFRELKRSFLTKSYVAYRELAAVQGKKDDDRTTSNEDDLPREVGNILRRIERDPIKV